MYLSFLFWELSHFILSPFDVQPSMALASVNGVNPPKRDDSVNDAVITLAYKTIPWSTMNITKKKQYNSTIGLS